MKTSTFDASAGVLSPCRLLTITRRDGTVYRIAEAQSEVVISPNTWLPIGSGKISNVRHTLGGGVPSVSVTFGMSAAGPFKPVDVDAGKFKDAKIQIHLCDRTSPAASLYFTGYIGRTKFGWPQTVTFETRGQMARGKGGMMQHFQTMCRTDLGSVLCKIPIRPSDVVRSTAYALGAAVRKRTLSPVTGTPQDYQNGYFEITTAGTSSSSDVAYDPTVGATTTDGTMVVTARNAWLRYAQIASITDGGHGIVLDRDPDARAVDGWFNEGHVYFCSGYSDTEAEPIANWDQSDRKVTLYRDMTGLIAVNDWIELHRGCDKRKVTCNTVFANAKNFRGEEDFLGSDVVIASLPTPDGGGTGTGGTGVVIQTL